VLQAIGTILLVGILFIAVLVYSNTSGLAPVLNQIKAGVDQASWVVHTCSYYEYQLQLLTYQVLVYLVM
jgi:hypothetical protein